MAGSEIGFCFFAQHKLIVADVFLAQLACRLQAALQLVQLNLNIVHPLHGVDHRGNIVFTEGLQRGIQNFPHQTGREILAQFWFSDLDQQPKKPLILFQLGASKQHAVDHLFVVAASFCPVFVWPQPVVDFLTAQ